MSNSWCIRVCTISPIFPPHSHLGRLQICVAANCLAGGGKQQQDEEAEAEGLADGLAGHCQHAAASCLTPWGGLGGTGQEGHHALGVVLSGLVGEVQVCIVGVVQAYIVGEVLASLVGEVLAVLCVVGHWLEEDGRQGGPQGPTTRGTHTANCALCTVCCALCTVHCALCTVHCVLCTVHSGAICKATPTIIRGFPSAHAREGVPRI